MFTGFGHLERMKRMLDLINAEPWRLAVVSPKEELGENIEWGNQNWSEKKGNSCLSFIRNCPTHQIMGKCDKVFKNGLSRICGRQPLKRLLSPFLNTLSQVTLKQIYGDDNNS